MLLVDKPGAQQTYFWLGNVGVGMGYPQRAELRVVDNATDCRKLKVGGKTLQSPAFYIEVQGQGNDLERVHAWVTKNLAAGSTQLTGITQPIDRPKAGRSPSCPT